MLDRILKLIIATWEGEVKSFSANIMNGLARLLYAYQDNIKDEIFKEKLGEISIKEISKTAKERRAGSLGYAEAMLIFYNNSMKCPLQWNILYSNNIDSKKKKRSPDSPIMLHETASIEESQESQPEQLQLDLKEPM